MHTKFNKVFRFFKIVSLLIILFYNNQNIFAAEEDSFINERGEADFTSGVYSSSSASYFEKNLYKQVNQRLAENPSLTELNLNVNVDNKLNVNSIKTLKTDLMSYLVESFPSINFNIEISSVNLSNKISFFERECDAVVIEIKTYIDNNLNQLNFREKNSLILLAQKVKALKNIVYSKNEKIDDYVAEIQKLEQAIKDIGDDITLNEKLKNNDFAPKIPKSITGLGLRARAYIFFMKIYGNTWTRSSKDAQKIGYFKLGLSSVVTGVGFAHEFFGVDFGIVAKDFLGLNLGNYLSNAEKVPFIINDSPEFMMFSFLCVEALVKEWFFGPRIAVFINILNNVNTNFGLKVDKSFKIGDLVFSFTKENTANIKTINGTQLLDFNYLPIIYNFFQGFAIAGLEKITYNAINPALDSFFSYAFLSNFIGISLIETAMSALCGAELNKGLIEKNILKKENIDKWFVSLESVGPIKSVLRNFDYYEAWWGVFIVFDVFGKGSLWALAKWGPTFNTPLDDKLDLLIDIFREPYLNLKIAFSNFVNSKLSSQKLLDNQALVELQNRAKDAEFAQSISNTAKELNTAYQKYLEALEGNTATFSEAKMNQLLKPINDAAVSFANLLINHPTDKLTPTQKTTVFSSLLLIESFYSESTNFKGNEKFNDIFKRPDYQDYKKVNTIKDKTNSLKGGRK